MTQDEQFLRAIQETILKELREFLGTSSDDPLLKIKHVLGSIYEQYSGYGLCIYDGENLLPRHTEQGTMYAFLVRIGHGHCSSAHYLYGKVEMEHYDALEEDLQRFFYIWYYQNSTVHHSEDECCDIIMQSFDDETRKHYSLKWDARMDRLRIVFKRADGKRSSSSIDICSKWFADANITGMMYLTNGMTWIPKERIHELFQML